MIGRESLTSFFHLSRNTALLLPAALACALAPAAARAASNATLAAFTAPAAPAGFTVRFVRDGVAEQVDTTAHSVGGFLSEQGVVPQEDDFVSAEAATPLTDGMTIEYRSAVPVKLVVGGEPRELRSAAPTVGALLSAQGVELGPHDTVSPGLAQGFAPGSVVRVRRIDEWVVRVAQKIAPKVVDRVDVDLAPNGQKVVRAGSAGLRELVMRVTKVDGVIRRSVIAQKIVKAPQTRIVARGVGALGRLTNLAVRGFQGTLKIAGNALHMLATAYTSRCIGCSGYTALGMRAGRGVVAVDPAFIPLGTKLFIPGYGPAVAGDTGSAIRGNRIDLGFNSSSDAVAFGRRPVNVYVLR